MDKIKVRYEEVELRNIEESEINAQEMTDVDFRRLVNNLRKDKVLTSTPLLMEQNDKNKYLCISGHHRIKAALKANILKSGCLIIDEVDESTRIRLQLSHNDIHGEPNEAIVRILQQKLNDIDIELINQISDDLISNTNTNTSIDVPQFRYINVCLLDQSRNDFVDMLIYLDNKEDDINYLISNPEYKEITDLLTLAHKKGYKSPGQAFRRFLDIVIENKNEL